MTRNNIHRELNIIQQNVIKEIGETFQKIGKYLEDSSPKNGQGDNLLTSHEHLTSKLFDYYAQIKLLNSNFLEKTLKNQKQETLKFDTTIPDITQNLERERERLKTLNSKGQFDYIDYDKKLVKFLQDGDCTSMASFISLFKDCSSFVFSPKGENNRKFFKNKCELKNSINDQNFKSNNIMEKQSSIVCQNLKQPFEPKIRNGLSSLNLSSVEKRDHEQEFGMKNSLLKISNCENFGGKNEDISTRNGGSEKENMQPVVTSTTFVR